MSDPNTPSPPDEDFNEEVKTNLAIEQGLGVGARELASIHESGALYTLELDSDGVEPPDMDTEIGGAGRSIPKT